VRYSVSIKSRPFAGGIAVRHAARSRLLCIATILMYPTTLTLAAKAGPR
jgi:hypothetical protein